jgi:hypothetical protein
MDFGFYNIVLIIAVVFLILTLTYIGVKMTYQAYSAPFPPIKATCPDYWTVSDDGQGCIFPHDNTKPNYGSPGTGGYNAAGTYSVGGKSAFKPSDPAWASYQNAKGATCGLRTWANTYGIVWDGVTNYNGC